MVNLNWKCVCGCTLCRYRVPIASEGKGVGVARGWRSADSNNHVSPPPPHTQCYVYHLRSENIPVIWQTVKALSRGQRVRREAQRKEVVGVSWWLAHAHAKTMYLRRNAFFSAARSPANRRCMLLKFFNFQFCDFGSRHRISNSTKQQW